jgi:solute carrier family 13 (sodium-dependent dicarboxylate transporter), member 2/3/5
MLRTFKIVAGPLAALLLIAFTDLSPGNPMVTRMAAITVWMAIWWFTEAVHLAVTALLPFVMIPLMGIADPKLVAFQYMDQIIFLFIGGFLLSFAVERWGLHERLALRILQKVGTKSENILLGVMLTSFLISMWISNTATVMMLLSAVLAIIYLTEKISGHNDSHKNFPKALLIGLAYSATIGGMATLVGTPPNMVFIRAYQEAFPMNKDMNFAAWFSIGFPAALVLFVMCFFVLKVLFLRKEESISISRDYFKNAYTNLGPVTYEQKVVSVIFILAAVLWFTRADIDFGVFQLHGWSNFFTHPEYIQDSTVAITMALILFLFPSKNEKGKFILEWEQAKKLPYDIILLFGGGFALAKGFEISGLSNWLAVHLMGVKDASPLIMIFIIVALVCIISEFASNVASIQLVLPILIAFQKDTDLHPLLLMIPATLAASLGFMLPVATAPNTIVFGSRKIHVRDMARAGLLMDLAGIVVITFLCFLLLS